MKKYFLFIFISLIGYIISISNVDADYEKIYDMEYSKEYFVNMTSYPDGRIPYFTNMYFRLPVNPKNKNAITIKMLKDEASFRSLGIYFFSEKPNDEDAKNSWGSSMESIQQYSITNDNPYQQIVYELEEIHSEKFMVIRFYASDNHFLSVYVSSYKEKKWLDLLEIKYNQEFVLKNIDSYKNSYMFWVKLPNDNDGTIRIKFHQNDTFSLYYFDVYINEYSQDPSKGGVEPINPRQLNIYKNEKENNTQYIKYYYNYYDLRKGDIYIMILISNSYNLRYFSIGVGKNITDYIDYNGCFKLFNLNYAFFALLLLIF